MPIPSKLLCGLRGNLKAIVSRTYSHQQLNAVVGVAHALASSFLLSKKSLFRLSELHGLSHTDLSLDCIADVFQQDDAGSLIQLNAYFAGIDLETASDQQVLAHPCVSAGHDQQCATDRTCR